MRITFVVPLLLLASCASRECREARAIYQADVEAAAACRADPACATKGYRFDALNLEHAAVVEACGAEP